MINNRLFFAAIIILSAVCPIANAWCVIELLVGMSNLKVHYWIEHGVYLSIGSNLLVWPPTSLTRESAGPIWHAVIGLTLVNIVSFLTYFVIMVALLS